MSDDPDNSGGHGRFASPPCYAGEIAPDYFDPLAVDPEQARDVARWRKAERTRLRAGRMELPVATRKAAGEALAGHLRQLLLNQFDGARGMILSAYWPIKGEPDLRSLMGELHEAGVVIAFPVVGTRFAPLIFRRWTPETRMVRGDWNIPVPPSDSPWLPAPGRDLPLTRTVFDPPPGPPRKASPRQPARGLQQV